MHAELAAGAEAWRHPSTPQWPSPFRRMVTDLVGVKTSRGKSSKAKGKAGQAWQDRAAWLRALHHEVVDTIESAVQLRRLQVGETLIASGEAVPGWFGVIEGFLVVGPLSPLHARCTVGLPVATWFGEQDLLLDRTCETSVTALVPSVVATFRRASFEALLEQQPTFTRFVLQAQAQRLATAQSRLLWPRHLSTNGRVALRLAELFATEALFDGDYHVPLTQASLSTFVGLSRQRTNEALNRLRRCSELELTYGGIRVHNPSRLMRRALDGMFD
jgi:CRP-like cAMP-binding protein